jgi:cell division protein FtsW
LDELSKRYRLILITKGDLLHQEQKLAASGLAVLFGLQAVINIAVSLSLMPAKGMTLPFVSYGGSSVIAAGITVGMLLAFTRTRPQGQIGDILFKRGR